MNEIDKTQIEKLNGLHSEILDSMRSTVYKAVEAGEILQQVKETLPHGEFTQWVENNVTFDIRTAQRYMKAHDNRDRLKNDTVSYLRQLTEDPEPQKPRTKKEQNRALADILGNNPKIRVTEVGIEFLDRLTFGEWEELMKRTAYLNPERSFTSWIIGDLMNHAEETRSNIDNIRKYTLEIARELILAKKNLPENGKTLNDFLKAVGLSKRGAEGFLQAYDADTDDLREDWHDLIYFKETSK